MYLDAGAHNEQEAVGRGQTKGKQQSYVKDIEWSLRAFASIRAVRLFLRTRAVINFLMRPAGTLEISNGEQQALRIFSASWNLSSLKRCFAPSHLADTFKTGQQVQNQVT